MKKIIILGLSILFIFNNLSIIYASTKYDSLCLSEEEKEPIEEMAEDEIAHIVKLYNGGYMYYFANEYSLDNLLDEALQTYYLVVPKESLAYYMIYTDDGLEYFYASDWLDFYQYAVSPELVFDSSVEVLNVYCLDGEPSWDGVYIYYVTSEGDYVLYKEYLSAESTFIFPLEDFCQYAEKVWAERSRYEDSFGIGVTIQEFNLEPYVFEDGEVIMKSATVHIWIGVAVLVLFLVCVVVIKCRQSRETYD